MIKPKISGTLLSCLWILMLMIGCDQQPKNQVSGSTLNPLNSKPIRNETVVAGTPITAPAIPANPVSQLPELAKEKTALNVVPVDVLAKNKAIQLALRNANFYTGEIDGKIGAMTKSAIRQFQVSKSLTPDGVVGAKTWIELKTYLPENQALQKK